MKWYINIHFEGNIDQLHKEYVCVCVCVRAYILYVIVTLYSFC
jgi:hypothetical protein